MVKSKLGLEPGEIEIIDETGGWRWKEGVGDTIVGTDKESREDKLWIHREQTGKVRGVQRLGFKPVCKKRSWW